MAENNRTVDAALEGLDESKRSTLKRLIGTGAFVRPIVVSFAMADLSIDAFMHAAVANLTTTTTPRPPPTTTPGPGTTTPGPGTTTPGPGTTTPGPGTTTPGPGTTAWARHHHAWAHNHSRAWHDHAQATTKATPHKVVVRMLISVFIAHARGRAVLAA